MSMTIRNWPMNERPREKFLHQGPESLSDAEILAIFLRVGTQGKSVIDLARDLLNQYGGLRSLLEAPQQQICQFKGIGISKYVQIHAALEIGRRYLSSELKKGPVLLNSKSTKQFLTAKLRHFTHEVFACLFVDSNHHYLNFKILFTGTFNQAIVYPREIAREALTHNAAAVILAHNHPSGLAQPSEVDKEMTISVMKCLRLIDVQVLDHIIIGDTQTFSFAEHGVLS